MQRAQQMKVQQAMQMQAQQKVNRLAADSINRVQRVESVACLVRRSFKHTGIIYSMWEWLGFTASASAAVFRHLCFA